MKGSERNKPCPCGSGKKAKYCLCWQIELAHDEALIEHRYREHTAEMIAKHGRTFHTALGVAGIIGAK